MRNRNNLEPTLVLLGSIYSIYTCICYAVLNTLVEPCLLVVGTVYKEECARSLNDSQLNVDVKSFNNGKFICTPVVIDFID